MPDLEDYITIVEEQRELVLAIEDARISHFANDIAYYTAMIDAAEDDPIDDPDVQEQLLDYFHKQRQPLIETYQSLVNDELP